MTGSESDRRTTIDHATIRRWVERHGGEPAAVADDAPEEAGTLRIRFSGSDGDTAPEPPEDGSPDESQDDVSVEEFVEPLDWETFFEKFEERELALVYREASDEDGSDEDSGQWYELADRIFVGEF